MTPLNAAKYLLSIATILLVAGCSSSGFTTNTNLDGERIRDYFGSRNMTVIKRDENVGQAYEIQSIVTGDSCQRSRKDPPASNNDALQKMREQAYRFKAEAIIDAQCYPLPADSDDFCYSRVTCFGQAVQWRN